MLVSGFLIEVKKADMDNLRRKHPEAFNRTFDPVTGLESERTSHNG
jgi:hypothetical protein